jgi:hypothetical protein
MVALMLSFLPAASVFAAPAIDGVPVEFGDLDGEWKDKVENLRFENLFYSQARFLPADFEDQNDLARAYELLHKYGFALKQANAILVAHAGFDRKGDVLNEKQADQSVRDLGMYLGIMRGLRDKITEEGYKIHRLR